MMKRNEVKKRAPRITKMLLALHLALLHIMQEEGVPEGKQEKICSRMETALVNCFGAKISTKDRALAADRFKPNGGPYIKWTAKAEAVFGTYRAVRKCEKIVTEVRNMYGPDEAKQVASFLRRT